MFDHIEMFYNPKRKHAHNAMLSPMEFETRRKTEPAECLENAGLLIVREMPVWVILGLRLEKKLRELWKTHQLTSYK